MMAAAYPKKAPIKPNVQMRQLHWGKLADGKVKGTMWDGEVDDGHVTLDIDELEGMFAAVASKKEGDVEGRVRSETKGPKKPEVVTLVDPKTANNTAIALSRFRLPPGDPHPPPPPSPSPPTPHPLPPHPYPHPHPRPHTLHLTLICHPPSHPPALVPSPQRRSRARCSRAPSCRQI